MIIIPMAGQSSRFASAGHTRPKYELALQSGTLFAACTRSFEQYFSSERFVFVCRAGLGAEGFIDAECERLGVQKYIVVALDAPTRGQAETVLQGLHGAEATGRESLLIFNIDTIRPHYVFPEQLDLSDGYLEVFSGTGDHWSFVKPAASFSRRVAQTSEKRRISNLCCTGLYHFSRAVDFDRVCREALGSYEHFRQTWGELYVAPLYNMLIASGKTFTYHEIPRSQVHFSGTPDEYEALRHQEAALF